MSAEWLTADIGWWQSEQAGSEVAMSAAASGRPLEGPWRDPPGPVGEGAAPRDPLRGLPGTRSADSPPPLCVFTLSAALPLSSGFSVPSRCLWLARPCSGLRLPTRG